MRMVQLLNKRGKPVIKPLADLKEKTYNPHLIVGGSFPHKEQKLQVRRRARLWVQVSDTTKAQQQFICFIQKKKP
jgi:hypothetical protein